MTAASTPHRIRSPTIEEQFELRRGPWTVEEDSLLIEYITCHGEGRWNLLAQCAGLKRTGKSCRLRWLNYLKPDIKRGNLTPQEQLMILQLHSRWGNRWSKIAQHLPGRTDNEIKNYWRTRVQKQARHLKIESNSEKFIEAIRCLWIPRLQEQMEQTLSSSTSSTTMFSNEYSVSLKMESENSIVDSSLIPHLQAPTESSSSFQEPNIKLDQGLPQSNESFSDYYSRTNHSQLLPEIAEHQPSPGPDSESTAYDSAVSNHGYYVGSCGYDVELNLEDTSAVGPRGCWFTEGQVAGDQWISDNSMTSSLWSPDELWQF